MSDAGRVFACTGLEVEVEMKCVREERSEDDG
jgi:hypothetical protein